MSKYKQVDQCADIIVYTMEEFPHSIILQIKTLDNYDYSTTN